LGAGPNDMKSRTVFIESGGLEVAVPVQEQPPELSAPPATAPMFEHARMGAGAVLVLARVCEISPAEFVRKYV
jgi:hypothetical protein